ncbi:MAG: hypothetical protein QOD97_912 [Mycobacterium sp.]|nr:hypothetical protein [Mycobacterium sp.]
MVEIRPRMAITAGNRRSRQLCRAGDQRRPSVVATCRARLLPAPRIACAIAIAITACPGVGHPGNFAAPAASPSDATAPPEGRLSTRLAVPQVLHADNRCCLRSVQVRAKFRMWRHPSGGGSNRSRWRARRTANRTRLPARNRACATAQPPGGSGPRSRRTRPDQRPPEESAAGCARTRTPNR